MAEKCCQNLWKNVGQINAHCGQLKHANGMGICKGKTKAVSHILVVFILWYNIKAKFVNIMCVCAFAKLNAIKCTRRVELQRHRHVQIGGPPTYFSDKTIKTACWANCERHLPLAAHPASGGEMSSFRLAGGVAGADTKKVIEKLEFNINISKELKEICM